MILRYFPFFWQISYLFLFFLFANFVAFNTISYEILKKFSHFFWTTVCKKFKFVRFALFAICNEYFIWCWREKTGKKLANFCFGSGKEFELLSKIFILGCVAVGQLIMWRIAVYVARKGSKNSIYISSREHCRSARASLILEELFVRAWE